ncbi:phosphopantetheine-binding protein [Paraburkholderia phosphatilytica]|uniref:phosphopantetheine-binding protein n=1 Tax=Paraburkholderia phosphatilytica TaxID=2282883 RepID=UPI000E4BBDF5|nr:phosphopantetheine-binding protein [Paraburkholderia phosphatilytica]
MDSLKLELKQLLIDAFDLEHLTPADIADDAPLFDSDGIGLDSIDALEIGIVLRRQYQLTISPDDPNVREYFRSIDSLAALIASRGQAAGAAGGAADAVVSKGD